ncbi:unnamed protein product, partial [Ectocarpus sp. 12 AP-2014]
HSRRGAVGHDRRREAEDPGQGGHPPGPAAFDLRRQAAGGRPHPVGLQHPEGIDAAPGASPPWRTVDTSASFRLLGCVASSSRYDLVEVCRFFKSGQGSEQSRRRSV